MADKNMKAKINVEFEEAASRQQINSGEDVSTLFGKIRKFLADLKAVAFSGAYSDLSGTPDLTQYASKAKYGDSTIDVGRKAGTTVGDYSTAEGLNTTASGVGAHAEGVGTIASYYYSHAEGYATTASGEASHAGGFDSTASGVNSFAHGRGAKALHESEAAFGQYNESNEDTVFSVGDGTINTRHNAFEITTTGGKLHDKDIATTDMSLPANGGNAEAVGGFTANLLLKNVANGNPLTTSIDTAYVTGTYAIEASFTPDFPTGYGTYGFLDVRAYGSICYQTVRFENGIIINRAAVVGQSGWTPWKEISTTPIKSTDIFGITDQYSNLLLWKVTDARKRIFVTMNGFYAIPFLTSDSDYFYYYAGLINCATHEYIPNTPVSGTVYYIE